MDEKELLVGFLSKTLKMDESAVTSALYDQEGDTLTLKSNALDILSAKDADRIRIIGDASKNKFQDGYQKAKKEERSLFEQEIKDQYGITSDTIGLDLIGEIIMAKTKQGEITDEVIMKHPSFIKKEKELIKAKEDAVNEILTKQKSEKNTETFTKKALEVLDELKPILPTDPKKAANQKNLYKMVLAGLKYNIAEGGEIIFLNEDGSRMQDEHGHPIDSTQYLKTLASNYFDFQAADQRQAGGDPNNKGNNGGQGGNGLKKPATKEEYAKQMNEIMLDRTMDTKDRIAKQNELRELAKDLQ